MIKIMHEYFKGRRIWPESKEGTTALEIVLDIYATAGTVGDDEYQETWSPWEWNTKYIFNLKQLFRHFVEGHNPLKFHTSSNLSKYKIGTTNLTLPFKVQLNMPASVHMHLNSFRDQNITFKQWLIFKEPGPRRWPQLKNFDDESFGNKARIQYGLEPCPRTADADQKRQNMCRKHNETKANHPRKHEVSNNFIMPAAPPPVHVKNYPQWWYVYARASCTKCGQIVNFKELKNWLSSPCTGTLPMPLHNS